MIGSAACGICHPSPIPGIIIRNSYRSQRWATTVSNQSWQFTIVIGECLGYATRVCNCLWLAVSGVGNYSGCGLDWIFAVDYSSVAVIRLGYLLVNAT